MMMRNHCSFHNYILHHKLIGVYVCMYVCMYVCSMYVCIYVCSMYVCMYVCMYVFMYIHVCMYVVCMYVVCMYVCMYVCVYNLPVLYHNYYYSDDRSSCVSSGVGSSPRYSPNHHSVSSNNGDDTDKIM